MERIEFNTSLGTVPIWGHPGTFNNGRPLLLAIRGLFPVHDYFTSLITRLPHADLAFAHLPGFHSPPIRDNSAAGIAHAFDEVLAKFGRPANVLGISMGGVIALGLRSPLTRSVLALDSPLSSDGLAPLSDALSNEAGRGGHAAQLMWDLCGVRPGEQVRRDYHWVVQDPRAPAMVMLGDPAADISPPTLVSSADREAYRASRVRTRVIEGAGHDLPDQAIGDIMTALRAMTAPVNSAGPL